ncbi:hypothetical protein ACIBCD_41520 [Nocardia brasiliensis]|uniref:hypothetical protein n=1 Tax=Nocardia brasiliensis TaxID=37326 RepID=UPI0037B49E46
MRFATFTGTALVVAVAMGAIVGQAGARPPEETTAGSASGIDKGVEYHAGLTAPGEVLTTAVAGGLFDAAEDGTKMILRSGGGEVVAEIPLTFQADGHKLRVDGQIADDGRKLKLTPRTAVEIGEMQQVSSMARLVAELEKNVVGMVVGGVLGGIIGAVLGLGFLSLLTGPIGLVVGAAAGGFVMGGQPFSDAVFAVLNGQP